MGDHEQGSYDDYENMYDASPTSKPPNENLNQLAPNSPPRENARRNSFMGLVSASSQSNPFTTSVGGGLSLMDPGLSPSTNEIILHSHGSQSGGSGGSGDSLDNVSKVPGSSMRGGGSTPTTASNTFTGNSQTNLNSTIGGNSGINTGNLTNPRLIGLSSSSRDKYDDISANGVNHLSSNPGFIQGIVKTISYGFLQGPSHLLLRQPDQEKLDLQQQQQLQHHQQQVGVSLIDEDETGPLLRPVEDDIERCLDSSKSFGDTLSISGKTTYFVTSARLF
jgi:hypothetical protein